MKTLLIAFLLTTFFITGCNLYGEPKPDPVNDKNSQKSSELKDEKDGEDGESNIASEVTSDSSVLDKSKLNLEQPKNVREFFMVLPREYFEIEGCDSAKDKGCIESKTKYIEKYLTIDDSKNGYFEAGGDGAQASVKMAIFRKPNGSYLVGLNSFGESADIYKFLEYRNGNWSDVSIEVVPEYSTTNIYEFPRKGTTIAVFAKEIVEQREGFEVSKKGVKLYDLIWNEGEFSIRR